ncbi:hypothetical protein COCMIDRAFT_8222 [Bipolaris oryzae ATCC 44560]|uniref:Uncharacterized protein n=1 Tax=Bipolaris oryzae ATCC 44560 TaxID=930090 RepID=W6Z3B5_COCMI|nr:uncharacterized protein COCMIDRAFT_8222 [Bipolaris oryzae ATCC 44560]EUC42154.1 hypothetical protein COCMIDRAFT_8222 [Bipolaris oryzae ATCC 44560]
MTRYAQGINKERKRLGPFRSQDIRTRSNPVTATCFLTSSLSYDPPGLLSFYRCNAQSCSASAFVNFLSAFSAGVSVTFDVAASVFVALLSRFDGSSDFRSDFVLFIVDDEVIDIVSFSGADVDAERVDDMLSMMNSVFCDDVPIDLMPQLPKFYAPIFIPFSIPMPQLSNTTLNDQFNSIAPYRTAPSYPSDSCDPPRHSPPMSAHDNTVESSSGGSTRVEAKGVTLVFAAKG